MSVCQSVYLSDSLFVHLLFLIAVQAVQGLASITVGILGRRVVAGMARRTVHTNLVWVEGQALPTRALV